MQLRHISSYGATTGVAQECRGWRWAEPFTPDANGDVNVDLTLFEACPDLAVIVSSTDPDPAQLPTRVDWTVTTRAISTDTVVEDLGGHGISYRVEQGPDLDRFINPGGRMEIWVNVPEDVSEDTGTLFCVYAEDWKVDWGWDFARLRPLLVDSVPVSGNPSWRWPGPEAVSHAGRHLTDTASGRRDCTRAGQLTAGFHRFTVGLHPDQSTPVRFDAVYLNYYRTDYCVDPEPWKDEYPGCSS